jgi:hypothetical protein
MNFQNLKLKLIFCASQLDIPSTIILAEQSKKKFIIITDNITSFNFLKKNYPRSKIIYFLQPKKIFYLNFFLLFKNIYYNLNLKKKINKLLSGYSNSEVFFSFDCIAYQLAYAVKILSKKNTVYFNNTRKDSFLYKIKFSFRGFLNKVYLKAMYGIDSYIVQAPSIKYFLFFSRSFFDEISAKNVLINLNHKLLKKTKKKYLNGKIKKIFLLSMYTDISSNILAKEKLDLFLKEFTLLVEKKDIYFKIKNLSDKKMPLEKSFYEIPYYIPANICMYHFNVIVGYGSATLFEAANAGIKAISLIDILKTNETMNASCFYKKFLLKNLDKNKKIYFPKSMNEFVKNFRHFLEV